MKKQELKEKYFQLKGMFLELKEAMEQNKIKIMGLGLSHGIVNFDNFKLEIHSEETEEILLRLYCSNIEVACVIIEKEDSFEFYYDDITVDFNEAC